MDEAAKAALLANLSKPAKASAGSTSAEQHDPMKVIEALKALASDDAMNRDAPPFRVGKFVPPGT